MKFNKKIIYNILFFGFIIFLFTPFGTGTRAKLNQGFAYVRTFIISPKADDTSKRLTLNSYDFPLKGIYETNDVNLDALKGKVVFINYWATWCPPCRAEMPMIKSLYDDYKDKVVFLFITSDDKEKVTQFYTKNSYNFPTYNALQTPPNEINTQTLPTTFILDKNGKVAVEEYGASNWNSGSVRKLLDGLISE